MSTIRWGMICAGRIANAFAADMDHVLNGEVHAIAARSLQNAQQFADKYNIPRAYGGYESLYNDPDIDAIYISSPHNFHLEQASTAMRAGKAVLCEKPLTVNPGECRKLIQLNQESGVYLMEAMWTWFLPAILKAGEWVAKGRIGAIQHIKADFGYPIPYAPDRREYDNTLAGGALLEMGVYPIALAWLFSGQDPLTIQSVSRFAPNGVEDDLTFIFNYDQYAATLGTSFRCRLRNEAVIVGDKGYIVIPDFFRASEAYLYHLDEQIAHFHDGRQTVGFNYQTEAVGNDLLQQKTQSARMPLSASLKFQEHIARVKQTFGGQE